MRRFTFSLRCTAWWHFNIHYMAYIHSIILIIIFTQSPPLLVSLSISTCSCSPPLVMAAVMWPGVSLMHKRPCSKRKSTKIIQFLQKWMFLLMFVHRLTHTGASRCSALWVSSTQNLSKKTVVVDSAASCSSSAVTQSGRRPKCGGGFLSGRRSTRFCLAAHAFSPERPAGQANRTDV